MELAKTIDSVRTLINKARGEGRKIGFVPTMGALHTGHISLIKAARENCDFVIISIFVNPSQFGPDEDFTSYPRPIEADLQICKDAGVDVVFAPEVNEIYPTKNITWVNVEKLTDHLCGASRAGHFRGVTTVCAKLFNIVAPDAAFFGQKDAQQAIVIRQMVADLNMPLEIVICPTIREKSGLAISSRNQYLTDQQKKDATLIFKSLQQAQNMIENGQTATEPIISQMRKTISQAPSLEIEYISIVDARSLEDLDRISRHILIAVAAKVGKARLIDNIMVDCDG